MEISLVQHQTTHFDWFGVDEERLIGHFTTAGLPASVAGSAEDLKLVPEYFTRQPNVRGSQRVDEDSLASALNRDWKGEGKEERYLRDFVSMADRGLFSYDIASHLEHGISYFRVASPDSPLTIDELPESVQKIVCRTILKNVRVRIASRVPYDAILEM